MNVEDAADQLYRGKVILAPMVRAGTLPFRALALRYGADTVFTEEVIDRRVVNAVRTENPVLGTVDYVEKRGKKGIATPFQTCPALERGRLVYQIGTGDATNALRAAQHVERDVAAVDINMGCPKRFSLQGGMGAALLKQPQVAADIVGTLRRNLSVPVSVKIRLLETPGETVEFARRMEKAGACALSVHVRKVGDTPASKARWEELRPVVDAVNIPVIANGDVYTRADMAGIKALSGCSSVMLARPALLNCSIFKPDGHVLPLKEVIQQYLRECFRYDSVYQNAKYTVMEMLTKRRHPDHLKESISLGLPGGAPGMREVTPAKTLGQLARLWDVGADFDAETVRRRKRAEQLGEATSIEQAERGTVHNLPWPRFVLGAAVSTRQTPSSCAGSTTRIFWAQKKREQTTLLAARLATRRTLLTPTLREAGAVGTVRMVAAEAGAPEPPLWPWKMAMAAEAAPWKPPLWPWKMAVVEAQGHPPPLPRRLPAQPAPVAEITVLAGAMGVATEEGRAEKGEKRRALEGTTERGLAKRGGSWRDRWLLLSPRRGKQAAVVAVMAIAVEVLGLAQQ
ncbi:conserved unknown protein [Ectocarpus siliculosus]|uniref:DUS-like FMN-binding domain-containing protein n=1 Tax=Ectocarpus siliculosus TaxID=2880 RepID=D8LPM6_ECTSI|nr:conserved unknown protein [Ectocarpus siliculosus]|eukprot:CBN80498.1 conserved unknown protein [Ectocarpus siliculosus]